MKFVNNVKVMLIHAEILLINFITVTRYLFNTYKIKLKVEIKQCIEL